MAAMRFRAGLLVVTVTVAVTAAAVAVAAGGCRLDSARGGPHGKAAPTSKRSITIGITQEPDTLWMPMKQMSASEHIGRPGALALTAMDEHIDLQSMAWNAHEWSWPADVLS